MIAKIAKASKKMLNIIIGVALAFMIAFSIFVFCIFCIMLLPPAVFHYVRTKNGNKQNSL